MRTYAETSRIALDSNRVVENADGSITVPARVARSGLQEYSHGTAFRPVEEVTDAESLASLHHIAVTVGHPKGGVVTSDNWNEHAVGFTVGEPRVIVVDSALDGHGETFVEIDLRITDSRTARRVLDGDLTELSSGYMFEPDRKPGRLPTGEHYDFIQRRIRHNHVALLKDGGARAGRLARVQLDSLRAERNAAKERRVALEVDLAKADAELEFLRSQRIDIDAEADRRVELILAVRELFPRTKIPPRAKPADIYRAVLDHVRPGLVVAADANEDELQGYFDAAVAWERGGGAYRPRIAVEGANDAYATGGGRPVTPYQAFCARLQRINPPAR